MKVQMNNKINKKGFTLMEMLIALAIFIIIVISATRIFQFVVEGQRQAIAAYQVQENLKYFFEVMSKETRMAKKNAGDCYPATEPDKVYHVENNNSELYFKNYNDECVKYYLAEESGINRFRIDRGIRSGYITPADINITNLRFIENQEIVAGDHIIQPSITVNLKAEAVSKEMHKAEMILQTTISSRSYE